MCDVYNIDQKKPTITACTQNNSSNNAQMHITKSAADFTLPIIAVHFISWSSVYRVYVEQILVR